MKLEKIEALCRDLAAEYGMINSIGEDMALDILRVREKFAAQLRHSERRFIAARDALRSAIAASPELFADPKTRTFYEIKVGFRKGTGGLAFEDADKTLALIRKHFGKDAPAYIITREIPDKKMLKDLSAGELQKLGVTVEDTGDVVVIKPVDGETARRVEALLAEKE